MKQNRKTLIKVKERFSVLSPSPRPKMPGSSAGTNPRSQHNDSLAQFRIRHRPIPWSRGGKSPSNFYKRQLFSCPSPTDKSSNLKAEDFGNLEELEIDIPGPQQLPPTELSSNISDLLQGISPSPTHPSSFSPKPGSLAEAATEAKKNFQTVQRGVIAKRQEESEEVFRSLPESTSNAFKNQTKKSVHYSPQISGPLSVQDINAKANKTGHCSSYISKRDSMRDARRDKAQKRIKSFEFSNPLVIENDLENNQGRKNPVSNEEMSTTLEVAVPEKLQPHKIGLKNTGMTCYLNSSLQALLGLPMVVTDAINLGLAMKSLSVKNIKLVSSFTSLCIAHSKGQAATTNEMAAKVKTDMESLDSKFVGNSMQDANEFLGPFLDGLMENIWKIFTEVEDKKDAREMTMVTDNGFTRSITNLVDTNFLYEKEETKVCCQCGLKSSAKWTDNNFLLPVKSGIGFKVCINIVQ